MSKLTELISDAIHGPKGGHIYRLAKSGLSYQEGKYILAVTGALLVETALAYTGFSDFCIA